MALRLFIDWIYSVPILLFTGASPAGSMRESKRLAAGRRMSILMMLVRWFTLVVLLAVVLSIVIAVLKAVFLQLAGENVPLVLVVTSALAVLQFCGVILVSIISQATLATAVARRFIALRSEVRLPDTLVGTESAVLRWAKRIFGAGWVAVLLLGSLTTLVAISLLNRIRFVEEVGITAHRGSSITAPENTMAAILLAIHVWTVNEVPLMNSMAGMGVDHIITDNPKLRGEVLHHRAGLTNAQRALLQIADLANRRF